MGILSSGRYTPLTWDISISIRDTSAEETRPESCTIVIVDK